MGKQFTITLDSLDLGQLLDGLNDRAESWQRTAEYLLTETMPEGELFLIEECSDPEEAERIAAHYRSIIQTIQTQMEAQR